MFVTPDAGKREFFYGVNFEYDYLMPKFADTRFGMEIRPIIGWRKGDYEFIVNPIIDLSFGRNGDAVFAPNARFARNFGENFALAVEYYTDLGPFTHFLPLKEQSHAIYGVTDFKIGRFDIEAGIGYGLTKPGSDRLVTKLMVTTNLFDSKEDESKSSASSKAALPTKAPKKAPTADVPYNYSGCLCRRLRRRHLGGRYSHGRSIVDRGRPPRRYVLQHAARQSGLMVAPIGSRSRRARPRAARSGATGKRRNQPWVWGAEGESGFMRLRGRAIDPYSTDFNNDTIDTTTIGNWYGSIAGRFGFAYERAWFYGKAGIGFTGLKSTVADGCSAAPCGTGLLNATDNSTVRAFPVAGGGIEWAWTGNWTLKFEYLFLGLTEKYAVCGPGGGTAAGSNFCSNHSLAGIHTTKLGLNYKIF